MRTDPVPGCTVSFTGLAVLAALDTSSSTSCSSIPPSATPDSPGATSQVKETLAPAKAPSSRRAKSVPQRVISKGATCRRTSSSSVSRRASSSRPTRRSMRHTLWLMVLRYARLFSSVAYRSSS